MSMMTGGGKNSQEIDLNLAPIIDCLTVLVTFMLASASFLSIGILEAGLGAGGEKTATETPPAIVMQAEIDEHLEVVLKITGKVNQTIHIPSKQGEMDFAAFKAELNNTKQKWPEVQSLILSAGENVAYKDVIHLMDEIRNVIPSVLLGGF